jgi:CheY-like chemotaxis protein
MTAHALVGDRERCLEAGMDDYIAKPIRKKDLVSVLNLSSHPPSQETIVNPLAENESNQPESSPAEVIRLDAALAAMENDRDVLTAVVEAFVEEVPELLTALDEAIESGDSIAAQRAAHTLKGNFRILHLSNSRSVPTRKCWHGRGVSRKSVRRWTEFMRSRRRHFGVLRDSSRNKPVGEELADERCRSRGSARRCSTQPRTEGTRPDRPSVDPALEQALVGINPAVAEKRPVRPNQVDFVNAAVGRDQTLLGVAPLGHDFAPRRSDERGSPELQSLLDPNAVGRAEP